MSWTTPADLKAQLMRLWERGELLRDAVTGNTRFPLRLALKTPNSSDMTDHFESVRKWNTQLTNAPHFRLETQALRHRVQGLQNIPSSVWVDSVTDVLAYLGKRREWERFLALIAATRQAYPALLHWLEKRPLQALELADDWPRLLAIVGWFEQHPRPGIYLRQVDVPGVHSKFIEAHRSVLTELLDLVLAAEYIDTSKTGVNRFAARYGFLEKPGRIRARALDPNIPLLPGVSCPDISLDADSFRHLAINVRRVLITENEVNFLALPNIPGTIAIFGSGYGWESLSKARWLEQCPIYYWGDIDTHGFAILNQLRGRFEQVSSFLMDRTTLDAHTAFWGMEDKPLRNDLLKLTTVEMEMYDDLRFNRIRDGLRLEQEHIGFGWIHGQLQRMFL